MCRGSWWAGLALLAFAAWWLWPRDADAPRDETSHDATANAAANASAAATDSASPATPDAAERSEAEPAAPSAELASPPLRVRLRGMHAKAPWTVPLHLDLDGTLANGDRVSHDAALAPDAQGLAVFALPSWAPRTTKARIGGTDPNYRAVLLRTEQPFDTANELVLDVQVVARVQGRVLDPQRAPLPAARVVAFAMRDGTPIDGAVGQTGTRHDGTFTIAVPPDQPLLLVVVPMSPSGMRGAMEGGAVMDDGRARSDLLPGSVRASGSIGAPLDVGDIVLGAASRITGVVRWSDGVPISNATVTASPDDLTTMAHGIVNLTTQLTIDERNSVGWRASGNSQPGGQTTTVKDGTFAVTAITEGRVGLWLDGVAGCELIGAAPMQFAIAGQHVVFELPRPVRLRATARGTAVPLAKFETDLWLPMQADREGHLDVVLMTAVRVRAVHEASRSPWREVPIEAAGTTVDFELMRELTPVSIEFDGDFRVRNATFDWHSQDGRVGREHRLRDDTPGAFQLFLEPGRYRVIAGPGGGERNGRFLMPVERDLDVGATPVELRLPAVFGGTFTLEATDSRGVHVGGHCRLTTETGTDVTPAFTSAGRGPGVLGDFFAFGTNDATTVLPPGTYALELQFQEHGVQQQRVVIRAREVTEVRVRLP